MEAAPNRVDPARGLLYYTVMHTKLSFPGGSVDVSRFSSEPYEAGKHPTTIGTGPMNMKKLTQSVYATGLHGITGQPVDEGFLGKGTLVRKVKRYFGRFGPVTTFQASTDDGESWYDHEAHCGQLPVEGE